MPIIDDSLVEFIHSMPKVELHVHLEGAIQPSTLLSLAERHGVALPARNLAELRDWYTFVDFPHFAEVYWTLSGCIRDVEDIELITREFLAGQAAQNIRYSEVTYTAYTHYSNGLAFEDQMAAIQRARTWAEAQFGVTMGLVIDISRNEPPETGPMVADWAIAGREMGVVALGLGGPEVGYPPELFADAFDRAHAAGLPCVPHAGETVGPESIWGALRSLHACRIGHGVRCLEDPALVAELRRRQIPLEVCPTSNLCLKVTPCIEEHPLPRLLAEGLYVTLNSDDPAMFNTSLTQEYLLAARAFGLGKEEIKALVRNAARASLLPEAEKQKLTDVIG